MPSEHVAHRARPLHDHHHVGHIAGVGVVLRVEGAQHAVKIPFAQHVRLVDAVVQVQVIRDTAYGRDLVDTINSPRALHEERLADHRLLPRRV